MYFYICIKLNIVDGKWSEWESWGICSVSCGGGYQIRTRKCNTPAPAYAGKDCKGYSHEVRECNTLSCQGIVNLNLTLAKYI